ncbi:JAB domain-containing protein [Chloroflexota bacterium]
MLYYVRVISIRSHPSGLPEASEDGMKLIKGLAETVAIMGIDVLNTVKNQWCN